jgi:hypothetical protein
LFHHHHLHPCLEKQGALPFLLIHPSLQTNPAQKTCHLIFPTQQQHNPMLLFQTNFIDINSYDAPQANVE